MARSLRGLNIELFACPICGRCGLEAVKDGRTWWGGDLGRVSLDSSVQLLCKLVLFTSLVQGTNELTSCGHQIDIRH